MGRKNRRQAAAPVRTGGGGERREQFDGAAYAVRTVSGAAATKSYRCPGCDHEIHAGVAHVVAWPADHLDAADRRHWHTSCWTSRETRRPGVQRGRSAPRY